MTPIEAIAYGMLGAVIVFAILALLFVGWVLYHDATWYRR